MMSSITNEKQPTSKPALKTGQDYISTGVSLTNTLRAISNPCVYAFKTPSVMMNREKRRSCKNHPFYQLHHCAFCAIAVFKKKRV